MVSQIFGINKKVTHHEKVAYTHSCGNVWPDDDFSEDMSKVTCKECKGADEFCSCGSSINANVVLGDDVVRCTVCRKPRR